MYRGMIAQDTFASPFELASAFHTAWLLADAALRAEIEQVIRVYTRRRPTFRAELRITLSCYGSVPNRRTDTRMSLATALHVIWQLADAPLRTEIEQVIRSYVRQDSHRIQDFQRIATMTESVKPRSIKRINPADYSKQQK
jgi:hypothetical protein